MTAASAEDVPIVKVRTHVQVVEKRGITILGLEVGWRRFETHVDVPKAWGHSRTGQYRHVRDNEDETETLVLHEAQQWRFYLQRAGKTNGSNGGKQP